MKPKTLLVVTALTFLLGAFIFFYEKDLPSTEQRLEGAGKVLDLKPEDITRLTLLGGDGSEPVILAKTPAATTSGPEDAVPADDGAAAASWHLEAPVRARADSDAVEDLLGRLTALPKSRDLQGADASELGLDTPLRTVRLADSAGEHELAVGNVLPLSGERALRREDGRLLQGPVDEELIDRLGRSAAEWRDKRLFLARRSAVEELTLERGGERLVFRRVEPGETFRLVEPLQDAVDGELMRGLLSAVTGLEAVAFDSASAGHDLGPATATLELRFGPDAEPWQASISTASMSAASSTPEVGEGEATPTSTLWIHASTALHDDELAQVDDETLLEALRRPVDAWRSRQWTTFQVFSVEQATFEGPAIGDPISLQRRDGEWHRRTGDEATDDEAGAIEYTAASDALYPVTEAQAVALVTPDEAAQRFDLSTPRLTVTLRNEGREDVLHLYSAAGAETAVGLEGRDAVLLLPTSAIDEWLPLVRALRDAPPPAR